VKGVDVAVGIDAVITVEFAAPDVLGIPDVALWVLVIGVEVTVLVVVAETTVEFDIPDVLKTADVTL
jgi:hypothetical protein